MLAYNVVSLNARQFKLVDTFHTPEAAAREVELRRSLFHTAIKTFEVAIEPLPAEAMTKSSRSTKPQAVRT